MFCLMRNKHLAAPNSMCLGFPRSKIFLQELSCDGITGLKVLACHDFSSKTYDSHIHIDVELAVLRHPVKHSYISLENA